jgi:hypothetical protein
MKYRERESGKRCLAEILLQVGNDSLMIILIKALSLSTPKSKKIKGENIYIIEYPMEGERERKICDVAT